MRNLLHCVPHLQPVHFNNDIDSRLVHLLSAVIDNEITTGCASHRALVLFQTTFSLFELLKVAGGGCIEFTVDKDNTIHL